MQRRPQAVFTWPPTIPKAAFHKGDVCHGSPLLSLPPPDLRRAHSEGAPSLCRQCLVPVSACLFDLFVSGLNEEWEGQMLHRGLTRRHRTPVNLASIDANSSGGWMGLPKTLVDMIFEHLKTDWSALLSCSLTCKALFSFARRVIHERLRVAGPKMSLSSNKLTEWCWIFNRRHLRALSLADDADLVQYTRHLIVEAGQLLTPRSLQPYILTFRKYVWLTSLTITRFNPTPFLPVFDRYFHHLSHSLRSLCLISPRGTPDVIVEFISQFRSLDDLEFNPVVKPPCRPQHRSTSLGPRRWFTPLGGTLRIVNTDSRRTSSLEPLIRLPGGLRFRSLEFVDCTDVGTSGVIQRCSSTLESVTSTLCCRESASLAKQCRNSCSPLWFLLH